MSARVQLAGKWFYWNMDVLPMEVPGKDKWFYWGMDVLTEPVGAVPGALKDRL